MQVPVPVACSATQPVAGSRLLASCRRCRAPLPAPRGRGPRAAAPAAACTARPAAASARPAPPVASWLRARMRIRAFKKKAHAGDEGRRGARSLGFGGYWARTYAFTIIAAVASTERTRRQIAVRRLARRRDALLLRDRTLLGHHVSLHLCRQRPLQLAHAVLERQRRVGNLRRGVGRCAAG